MTISSEWEFAEHVSDVLHDAHLKAIECNQIALVTVNYFRRILHVTYHDTLDVVRFVVDHFTIHCSHIRTHILTPDIKGMTNNERTN